MFLMGKELGDFMRWNSRQKWQAWLWISLMLAMGLHAAGIPIYRIHCGGPVMSGSPFQNAQPVDPISPMEWQADAFFKGGAIHTLDRDTVSQKKTLPFFRTERWSDSANPMSYSFPVANGEHRVILYFAEIFTGYQSVGSRVFHVFVNGKKVISDLDVFAKVGGFKGYADTLDVTADSGKIDITFQNVKGEAQICGIEIATPPLPLATQAPYRINCGSADDYVDPEGKTWQRDTHFLNGKAMAYQTFFTSDFAMFKTDRVNDTAGGKALTYAFPVTAGSYKVQLYFAEGWDSSKAVGDRVFHVLINGDSVLKHFDLVQEYGFSTAVIREFETSSDGKKPLTISFGNVKGSAKINAIEILPLTTRLGGKTSKFARPRLPNGNWPDLLGRKGSFDFIRQ
jgi:Malectin domain